MSKKTIQQRECDCCHKVVQQSEMQFGGSPFTGWLHVERTNGSTAIDQMQRDYQWDFCTTSCMITHFYKPS